MTSLLTAVSDVFTAVIGMVDDVATTIVGTPVLLLFCVAVPLCGIAVAMFKRLLSARG